MFHQHFFIFFFLLILAMLRSENFNESTPNKYETKERKQTISEVLFLISVAVFFLVFFVT